MDINAFLKHIKDTLAQGTQRVQQSFQQPQQYNIVPSALDFLKGAGSQYQALTNQENFTPQTTYQKSGATVVDLLRDLTAMQATGINQAFEQGSKQAMNLARLTPGVGPKIMQAEDFIGNLLKPKPKDQGLIDFLNGDIKDTMTPQKMASKQKLTPELEQLLSTRNQLQKSWDKGKGVTRKQIEGAINQNQKLIDDAMKLLEKPSTGGESYSQKLLKKQGIAYTPEQASYITKDGTMIAQSSAGQHAKIVKDIGIMGKEPEATYMQKTGDMRIKVTPTEVNVSFHQPPTPQQLSIIEKAGQGKKIIFDDYTSGKVISGEGLPSTGGEITGIEQTLKSKFPIGKVTDAKKSFITTDGKIIPMVGEDAHYNVFGGSDKALTNYLDNGGIRVINSNLNGKYPYLNIEINKAPTEAQLKALQSLPDNVRFVYDIRGGGKTISSDITTETKTDFLKTLNNYFSSGGEIPKGASSLHIPNKNIKIMLSQKELDLLSNENLFIPKEIFKKEQIHLTPNDSLKNVKEVSMEELKKLSPEAYKILNEIRSSTLSFEEQLLRKIKEAKWKDPEELLKRQLEAMLNSPKIE